MTVLAAMSTKELWSRLWDLLIQRMGKVNRANQQD